MSALAPCAPHAGNDQDGALPRRCQRVSADVDPSHLRSTSVVVGAAPGPQDADEWERRMVVERSSLRRVAAAVVAGSDPAAALAIAAEEVASLMGAEQGFVFRFEGDRAIVAGVHGIEGSPVGADHGMVEIGVLPMVFRTARPARLEGVARPLGRENSAVHWISPSYRGGIGAPVFVGDHLWGAVVAATTRDERFPPGAESRLAYFAEIAGIAIGNAEANARLAQLAMSDPLTGLPNHRVFHSTLVAEAERAARHGRPLAVAVMDVDHFKAINDRHGHLVGDRALIEVARRLALSRRRGDLIARVGGEEFAWILPGADVAGALGVAERARRAIADEPFPEVGAVTVSIGVAELMQAASASDLYRLADEALYRAKRTGRNRSQAHGIEEVEVSGDDDDRGGTPTRALVRGLMRVMEAKDPALRARCERVATLVERMALGSGWPADAARRLADTARVMDIGTIAAPAWRGHPVVGARIVTGVLSPDQVSWLRGHHERWDGLGFPDARAGEEIPLGARLLAVAERWDEATTPGPDGLRAARESARAEIAAGVGSLFCAAAVASLEALLHADPQLGA